MPYCRTCGKPVDADSNFCDNCGTQIGNQTPSQPTGSMQPNCVIGFLIIEKTISWARLCYFSVLVTNNQMVFARLNDGQVKEATKYAIDVAKGKNPPPPSFQQRHKASPASAIIAEDKNNFVLENQSIKEITLRPRNYLDDSVARSDYEVNILLENQTVGLVMNRRDDYLEVLRQAFGKKIRII
jgi:hypothetical protein